MIKYLVKHQLSDDTIKSLISLHHQNLIDHDYIDLHMISQYITKQRPTEPVSVELVQQELDKRKHADPDGHYVMLIKENSPAAVFYGHSASKKLFVDTQNNQVWINQIYILLT